MNEPPPIRSPYQPPAIPVSQLAGAQDPYVTTQEERTMGMLVHLLALLTGWLGVLIIWLVKKNESRFVDYHGKESLNFMITWFLGYLFLVAACLVIAVLTIGIGMLIIAPILIPLILLMGIAQLVFGIIACMAAHRGEWYRLPMTIRFIS